MAPRRKAIHAPGCVHELTFTCYHGYRFLQSERVCQWLVDAIDAARQRHSFALWAYVFMPEHVHLLLFPQQAEHPEHDMSAILRDIKLPVSRRAMAYLEREAPHWLPRLTRQRGQRIERVFWQSGGGYDRLVDQPKFADKMIRYIHLNPVRRGLVRQPEDWRWSSAGWYENRRAVPLAVDPIDL